MRATQTYANSRRTAEHSSGMRASYWMYSHRGLRAVGARKLNGEAKAGDLPVAGRVDHNTGRVDVGSG